MKFGPNSDGAKTFVAARCALFVLALALPASLIAQQQQNPAAPVSALTDSSSTNSSGQPCGLSRPGCLALNVLKAQGGIWTSPAHIRKHDFLWLVPFAAATALSLHYDPAALRQVGNDPQQAKDFRTASDITGIYLPLATLGTAYIARAATHHEHLRETGLLAGEAMLDATLVGTGLKYATNRQRPDQGDHNGDFWPHGTTGYLSGTSFPSGHAIGVWAFAHVVADEYPSWQTKLAVYTLASGVAASRVMGRAHFPTDVLVGSTFGYLIGGYVYNHRSANSTHAISFAPLMDGHGAGIVVSIR